AGICRGFEVRTRGRGRPPGGLLLEGHDLLSASAKSSYQGDHLRSYQAFAGRQKHRLPQSVGPTPSLGGFAAQWNGMPFRGTRANRLFGAWPPKCGKRILGFVEPVSIRSQFQNIGGKTKILPLAVACQGSANVIHFALCQTK